MRGILKFLLAAAGVVLVSGFPVLLSGLMEGEWLIGDYFRSLQTVLGRLWPIQDITVYNVQAQRDMPLFPDVAAYIGYSLQILFLALAAAVVSALLLTVAALLLPERIRERIKLMLYVLESLPDLLVIMLAQLAVIVIFKQTGFLVSKIAVLGEDRIYILPVLCLMILPMIQLFRLSMLTFQEEERQLYAELARSLGFSKVYIILVHLFRNAVVSVFFQSKKTLWFMLSNLFVLELMFNMPGIMLFLWNNLAPEVFLLTVFSFFLPVFLLYSAGEWFFLRKLRGKAVV